MCKSTLKSKNDLNCRTFNQYLRLCKRIAYECPIQHISDTFFRLLVQYVVSCCQSNRLILTLPFACARMRRFQLFNYLKTQYRRSLAWQNARKCWTCHAVWISQLARCSAKTVILMSHRCIASMPGPTSLSKPFLMTFSLNTAVSVLMNAFCAGSQSTSNFIPTLLMQSLAKAAMTRMS